MITDDCWESLFGAANAIRDDGGGVDLQRAILRFEGIGELPARAITALLNAVEEYAAAQDELVAGLEYDLDMAEAALDKATEAA